MLLQSELPGPWSDVIAGQGPWEQSALTLEELKVDASEGYDKRLKAGQTSLAPAVTERAGQAWLEHGLFFCLFKKMFLNTF